MRVHQLLSVAAAAATVQAFNPLHPRDLDECYAEATDIMTDMTDMPTPDATLLAYVAEQTNWATITGCEIPAITGAVGDSYSSYISSFSSWAVKHKTDIEKLVSACSDLPQVTSALNQYPGGSGFCSEFTYVTADATGAATSQATSEATGNATKAASSKGVTSTAGSGAVETPAASSAKTVGSSSSGSDSTAATQSVNAAPQKTGMAIAAAGMAGLALAGLY